ncbi:hypothetical protein HH308_05030 [Gordonia sp. TBRC 11910]|uniref:Uncharacterized protein n=1 Tax=Gordonia asplenii TaxID=2725283 RepID=A0A848KRL2_9ACTN|nr:hypothetical protein [Gordonia asplenii]NMO00577.1 hypothetical protein [Gordonia asplenii]
MKAQSNAHDRNYQRHAAAFNRDNLEQLAAEHAETMQRESEARAELYEAACCAVDGGYRKADVARWAGITRVTLDKALAAFYAADRAEIENAK